MSLDELIAALIAVREQGIPGETAVFSDQQCGELCIPTRVLVDSDGDVRVVVQ